MVADFAKALSTCTNLVSFALYQWMDYAVDLEASCSRVVTILDRLPTTLYDLRIDLDDEYNDGWKLFNEAGWEALRASAGQMAKLKTLELSADGMDYDGHMTEDCCMMVRKRMEEFDASGILRLRAT